MSLCRMASVRSDDRPHVMRRERRKVTVFGVMFTRKWSPCGTIPRNKGRTGHLRGLSKGSTASRYRASIPTSVRTRGGSGGPLPR